MTTDPFQLFDEWFAEAREAETNDPEAMALATADAAGNPTVRMVLLKGHGPDGFVFYTNEQSAKGEQLADNPSAALLFHWKSLRRQVRIEGDGRARAERRSRRLFRNPVARFAAWRLGFGSVAPARKPRRSSKQRYEEMKRQFEGQEVPRPPHWGGYRVVPDRIEFWTDRPHRLHERRLFTRADGGSWTEGLLYP